MKRYLVFGGENYYPSGGFKDFLGDFDTVAEATTHAKTAKIDVYNNRAEWWHVIDSTTGATVAED